MTEEPRVQIYPEKPAGGKGMWVPIANGRAIPGQFWAHIDDPALEHVVLLQVIAAAGETAVRELVVTRREGSWPFGNGVTAASLRKVNVGRLLRTAIDAAAKPRRDVKVEGIAGRAFTVESAGYGTTAFVSREVGGRRSRTTPEKLDEIARVYLEARAAGRSTRAAIKDRFDVEDSQAARLVRAARDAGKLAR